MYFWIFLGVLVVAAVGYWWMFMRKDTGKADNNKDMGGATDQPADMGGEKTSAPAADAGAENAPASEENTGQPTV